MAQPTAQATAEAATSLQTSALAAGSLLRRQLKQIQSAKDLPGISCGLVSDSNIFVWEVMLMIHDDCKYYGGKSTNQASQANKQAHRNILKHPPRLSYTTALHPSLPSCNQQLTAISPSQEETSAPTSHSPPHTRSCRPK